MGLGLGFGRGLDTAMERTWRWMLGMVYVIAVAVIWIVASFVVQSVVDAGVSPFLITYICNSLFVVYVPAVEGNRALHRWLKQKFEQKKAQELEGVRGTEDSGGEKETLRLLEPADSMDGHVTVSDPEQGQGQGNPDSPGKETGAVVEAEEMMMLAAPQPSENQREWSRREIAKVSLLICPFWFLAQFTFNLSLRYTTVTSNTILSSSSSLFTFLMSLMFLNEKFTWVKLGSVMLCMVGTGIVTLADSTGHGGAFWKAGWGDLICLFSAIMYATYSTLLRKRLPDEEAGEGKASTALFFGYLGLFNALLLGPVALLLHFTGVEPFHRLTPAQVGLVIGKGLLDNVLSDYLWAKAVLLTTPTAATAGLTIQVPIAAVVDSIRGKVPSVYNVIGAVAVLLGFFGINEPATGCCGTSEEDAEEFDIPKQSTAAASTT